MFTVSCTLWAFFVFHLAPHNWHDKLCSTHFSRSEINYADKKPVGSFNVCPENKDSSQCFPSTNFAKKTF